MEVNHQILCLNMIVKNKAPVIARCLASVRPFTNYCVIVDTGSTDGTQDVIRTLLADLPGEFHERPWRDFAHNRNEALELARPHGEYLLWIDADDLLEFRPEFKMPVLQADSYMIRIADGSVSYTRSHIIRAALPWRWRGVLHEFLTCDDARTSALLEGLQLRRGHDGARRREPETYRRDAEILHAALQTESDPFLQSRYKFYLAQSYDDGGKKEEALQAYLNRAELGSWVEEVFVSLCRAAKLQEALGRQFDEVMTTYQKAAKALPNRAAEALHGASRYCRLSERYKEGYEIAKRTVAKGAGVSGDAPDGLFVETWIYEYGLLDEFAANAYWAGAYEDCLVACEYILGERKCCEAERPRIESNAAFARQKLGTDVVAMSFDAKLGYWREEVFCSLYTAARLKEQLGLPEQDVIDAYLEASDAMPTRAEALHGASRYCNAKGRAEEGFQLAKQGMAIGRPSNGMCIESWIYDYGLLDELSVSAYWTGHYRESLDACVSLLASTACPPDYRERVAANARFALAKLPHDPNLGWLSTEGGFIEQHALVPPRRLRSRVAGAPRVLVAILAKQKEPSLPLYLECIEALDYPKSSIVLYIRTNNNTDRTESILREWVARVGDLYAGVEFDAEDVDEPVQRFGVHEWNETRLRVICRIRNISLRRALELECEFYFTADVDNFIRPCTLRELVALNLPIVAPFLRAINPGAFYSTFHAETPEFWGWYRHCDQYDWAVNRFVRGLLEMPVVHCTYLVRSDVIPELTYEDDAGRYDFAVFSESARKAAISQYLDNRQIYGYLSWDKDGPDYLYVQNRIERAAELLKRDFDS